MYDFFSLSSPLLVYRLIDIGVTQIIDVNHAKEVEELIAAAQDYVNNVVAKDDKLKPLLELCKNNHESCAFWAVLGTYERECPLLDVSLGALC